jgi:triosephosphate isomerase (TIM)
MALPRPIVFGNWKMHGLTAEADALASALAERKAAAAGGAAGTLGVFPPATVLARVAERLRGTGILVGGQDCHERERGAFTGSVSAAMLKDAGAQAVIVGHSERRHGLGEPDALVHAKAKAALAAGLLVVLCVGETEEEWAAGRTLERLASQLDGLAPEAGPDRLVVAYEPVWAIGTGKNATPDDAAQIHELIRLELGRHGVTNRVPILYGGSVNSSNVLSLLARPQIDGVLVGGASLDPEGWAELVGMS